MESAATAEDKAAEEKEKEGVEENVVVAVTVAEGKAEGAMARGDAGPAAAVAMAQVREAAVRVEAAMVAERAEGRAAAATVAAMGE